MEQNFENMNILNVAYVPEGLTREKLRFSTPFYAGVLFSSPDYWQLCEKNAWKSRKHTKHGSGLYGISLRYIRKGNLFWARLEPLHGSPREVSDIGKEGTEKCLT